MNIASRVWLSSPSSDQGDLRCADYFGEKFTGKWGQNIRPAQRDVAGFNYFYRRAGAVKALIIGSRE